MFASVFRFDSDSVREAGGYVRRRLLFKLVLTAVLAIKSPVSRTYARP